MKLNTRRDIQRDKLLADGRKALEMVKSGRSMLDVLMVIGGSRTRLYRAMELAELEDSSQAVQNNTQGDPLLL